jgi:DNA repair photolyase
MPCYRTIICDSLLKQITRTDDLFQGLYCIDPYQNCEFRCRYCDSSIDTTIYVKTNAADILEKELKKVKKGRIIIGSVHDAYQQAEKTYELTKNILRVIADYDFSCHIITKSPLIIRDIKLLSELDCYVTISILSLLDRVTTIFEQNVPSVHERLKLVQSLTKNGIYAGVALIPILPYIVDNEMENIIQTIKEYNANYFLHTYLELKGDQKQIVQETLIQKYPQFIPQYNALYADSIKPEGSYVKNLDTQIQDLCKKYNMPEKIVKR